MITFTIEADYMKDHSPKDLYHSCFHAVYIEIPPGWNCHFTKVELRSHLGEIPIPPRWDNIPIQVQTAHLIVTLDF